MSTMSGDGPARTSSMANTSQSIHNPSSNDTDLIAMTPYSVAPGHTLLNIVRLKQHEWTSELQAQAVYMAEGDHAGIVINKSANISDLKETCAPDASLSFKVFLVNAATQHKSMEHRTLRFWFSLPSQTEASNDKDNSCLAANQKENSRASQDYFRSLIGTSSNEFPKNYVEFIKKLMRMLKKQYLTIQRIEVELKPLSEGDKPLSRSSSIDGSSSSHGEAEHDLTSQRILELIESSYPNPVTVQDLCKLIVPPAVAITSQQSPTSIEPQVKELVEDLRERKKVTTTDGISFTRVTLQDRNTKINLVKQMPRVTRAQQPSIAIITAQYCEKMAVDAMISNKDTYVRYKTEGESANYIYTLGTIGEHHVVSTKLPIVGNSREALIAAGNTTTRLLGSFQQLDYIFLVGCGGGVVDYTNFANHVRLGDIVVSSPVRDMTSCKGTGSLFSRDIASDQNDYIYVHCEDPTSDQNSSVANDSLNESVTSTDASSKGIKRDLSQLEAALARQKLLSESQHQEDVEEKREQYQCRLWCPPSLILQKLAKQIWNDGLEDPQLRTWEQYIDEGTELLKHQDIFCAKPTKEADKLHMSIGPKDVIEVNHPEPSADDVDLRKDGRPMCHFGPIGSGRMTSKNSGTLRKILVDKYAVKAMDSEFDAVIESIYGNRKDSYVFIRGISDYRDGRRKKDWQQYAALIAASFMKSMILGLKPVAGFESEL
ncbi:hypothetical protein GZH46_02246, partial [Fragariocoptes setiger]